MYRIDIMTLFPEVVSTVMDSSILGRAQAAGHIKITSHQIRDYTTNKQNQVDDYPYGGGRGCVMQAQPLHDCWEHICTQRGKRVHTIYMSPCGKTFTEEDAKRLKNNYDDIILVCGHYEGVDQRFIDECVDEEISVGDFVLTGGEIPAMAVADAVCRLVPGVLSDEVCFTDESHWDGLLEYPQYSRPEVWRGHAVPQVLLSGNHSGIAKWRRKQSLMRTKKRRPDMYAKLDLSSKNDQKLLKEIEDEIMEKRLKKYAKLLINTGLNVQKGQTVVIRSDVENAEFARMCISAAYDAGAREVVTMWSDVWSSRQHFLRADSAVFDEFPEWRAMMQNGYAKEQVAWLFLHSEDPEMLSGVDPDRIMRSNKVSGAALRPFRQMETTNFFRWCIGAAPSEAWAKKVFPGMRADRAVKKLWEAILDACRVYEETDPVDEWAAHVDTLHKRMDILNGYNFKYLHYTNSLGTDLTVELPEGHFWLGGSEKAQDGVEFCANMPTEEIFTAPKRDGVNGVVYAAKPLALDGDIADKFSFTFKDGKIVEIKAEKGQQLLENSIAVDENASYLGEAALVPFHSPISQSGILFYNTLFDENAACHFAYGEAYPCVAGADKMTEEECLAHGLNVSQTHKDFMIGTPDLSIVGVTHDGKEIPVFVNGDFAF